MSRICLFVELLKNMLAQLFHDGRLYRKETRPLICSANEWTSFNMIGTSAINELTKKV